MSRAESSASRRRALKRNYHAQATYGTNAGLWAHPYGPVAAEGLWAHVDRVGVRMLVTYSGPGTEWLADADVDRARLGEAGQDLPDDQNGVMRPGAVIRSVAPFAVTLLKGEAWPGAEGFGAVHRSPDPGGAPRALLRVDMLSQRKPRD